jgi:hypothetical protein
MRNTVMITKGRQSVLSTMQQSDPCLPLPSPHDRGFDIRITTDGKWHYRGSPIERAALVRLFAGALTRDAAGDYWLETPAERGRIQVDDAPFLAVELSVQGAGRAARLKFRTNMDEWVTADAAHPIHLRPRPSEAGGRGLRPYLRLRGGIEALIARPVYYALADIAVEHAIAGVVRTGVWSSGTFFPLAPAVAADPP